jgi:rhamnose utilization protein RhaD (predicted bifunctional aldolase and dehydrogenase)
MEIIASQLQLLKEISSHIGNDRTQVQGPGGNTSYKNSDFLWVKASGTRLEDALKKEIFAKINMSHESKITSRLDLTPSIETPLHRAIEQTFVIHTHSTSAIAAGFSNHFERSLSENSEIVLIPYRRPGEELTKIVKDSINPEIHHSAILKNHGLLVWGMTYEELTSRFSHINNLTAKFLTNDKSLINAAKNRLLNPLNEVYLTPDHAVFLDQETLSDRVNWKGKKAWLEDLLDQLSIILGSMSDEESLEQLDMKEVEELRNWESEKLRKKANA